MESTPLYAVLSGDLVVAPRLAARLGNDLTAAMVASHGTLNAVFAEAFPLPIDLSRGHAWQFVTATPRVALRAGLYYRAELKARMGAHNIDTRVAIGIGRLDSPPEDRVVGEGSATRRSESALAEMPRPRRLALRLEDRPLGPGFDEMVALVDHVAGRWTDKQALAVTGALQGWTQERIARRWGRLAPGAVSQQTVAQHLHRAGWQAVAPALGFLEGLLA